MVDLPHKLTVGVKLNDVWEAFRAGTGYSNRSINVGSKCPLYMRAPRFFCIHLKIIFEVPTKNL